MLRGSRHRILKLHWWFKSQKLFTDGCSEAVLGFSAPVFWENGITGKGARCAIMGAGIYNSHIDMKGKIRERHMAIMGPISGQRDMGVASLISASGHMKGIAPDSEIIDIRVLDARDRAPPARITSELRRLVEQKSNIDVIQINIQSSHIITPENLKLLKALVDAGTIVILIERNPFGPTMEETPGIYISSDRYIDHPNYIDMSEFSPSVMVACSPLHRYQEAKGEAISAARLTGLMCLLTEIMDAKGVLRSKRKYVTHSLLEWIS